MDSNASRNSSPAGSPAADDAREGGRRRRRRRGSRGRGRRGRNRPSPMAEAVEPPSEPATASTDPAPMAGETASGPADTGPDAGPAPHEPVLGSGEDAPGTECAERAEADEIAEIEREARSIVSDAAVDERPELYAHRLPSFGAEIVHWRPRGEREFRYLLRESFD